MDEINSRPLENSEIRWKIIHLVDEYVKNNQFQEALKLLQTSYDIDGDSLRLWSYTDKYKFGLLYAAGEFDFILENPEAYLKYEPLYRKGFRLIQEDTGYPSKKERQIFKIADSLSSHYDSLGALENYSKPEREYINTVFKYHFGKNFKYGRLRPNGRHFPWSPLGWGRKLIDTSDIILTNFVKAYPKSPHAVYIKESYLDVKKKDEQLIKKQNANMDRPPFLGAQMVNEFWSYGDSNSSLENRDVVMGLEFMGGYKYFILDIKYLRGQLAANRSFSSHGQWNKGDLFTLNLYDAALGIYFQPLDNLFSMYVGTGLMEITSMAPERHTLVLEPSFTLGANMSFAVMKKNILVTVGLGYRRANLKHLEESMPDGGMFFRLNLAFMANHLNFPWFGHIY